MKKNLAKRKGIILVLLAASAAVWVTYIHLRCAVLPYDDSFIFYRFVDNFVAGKGLIYNLGERAWGYSTVTYIFWLSAWRYLLPSVPLPDIAVRANALPFAAVCLAAYFLVLRYTSKYTAALAAAALIMFNAALLGISTGGMETFLFMALALFSLLAAAWRKPLTAGFLAGLAVLTRIEGLVLLPILLIVIRKPWKAGFKMTVAMVSLPLAWLAFAHPFYGTYLPHSIIAKARPLYTLAPMNAYSRIIGYLGEFFSAPGSIGAVSVLLFLIACTIACFESRLLRDRGAWAVPMLFWGVFAAYSYGNPLLFEWYYPPLFITALVTAVLGVTATFQVMSEHPGSRRPLLFRTIGVFCAIWITAATIHGWTAPPKSYSPNWSVFRIDSEPGRLRCKAYKEAALWLNRVRGPHETVMAPEIGALGYYMKGNLIDACGLVSPEAIRYLPAPAHERLGGEYGSIPLAFVRDVQPDFIVTMPAFASKNVLDAPWAKSTYHIIQDFRLPLPAYGSDRVIILRHGLRGPVSDPYGQ
ncbi:MAG TPA: hypothetical protein VMR62_18750 [Bryobacteraceae bacterium]|nr:hypothetical protein [Bryobacteraceae bacterium]